MNTLQENINILKQETPQGGGVQTIRRFAELYPSFSQGSLRSLIWNEDFNGLNKTSAIIRLGKKKILIDVDEFFVWVKGHSNKCGGLK